MSYLESWAEERERLAAETLARLERGLQPRNTSEVAVAFVAGYDVRANNRLSVSIDTRVWFNDRPQLFSYATPIAYRDGDAVYVSAATYSSTTGKHLSQLRSALVDAGYVMDVRDCQLAPDDVYGGYLRREDTPFQRWVLRGQDRGTDDVWSIGTAYVSPNAKWSIVENRDSIGADDIPYIILGHGRWTAGYVLADGTVISASSQTIPAYVRRAVAELAGK